MGMVGYFMPVKAETIKKLKSDPDAIEEILFPEDEEPEGTVDLDKSWHCIHFILSGSADVNSNPLSWAVLGGEEVGDDMGYGPARLLEPQQVRSVAIALESIDEKAFESKYNPEAMQTADIYLADMCVRDGNEALEYIVENYRILRAFYKTTAENSQGAILWLS